MDVTRCASPDDFLAATVPYRQREPLRTNVMGSVATLASRGVAWQDEGFWWVVRDADEVVGAAFRTPPYALALGPMPEAALQPLAEAIAGVDHGFDGVNGFGVDAFLAAYAGTLPPGTSPTVASTERQVLYACEHLDVPTVEGDATVATMAEFDHARRWFHDFVEEIDQHRPPPDGDDAPLRATVGDGRLRWWKDHGSIVAMAGCSVPVEVPGGVVSRIGPVYTPPEERRHGYAAGVTAALTAELLAAGRHVMLFADAANATSNGVYLRLGYHEVDVAVAVRLTPRG
jgi:hypothetical protein